MSLQIASALVNSLLLVFLFACFFTGAKNIEDASSNVQVNSHGLLMVSTVITHDVQRQPKQTQKSKEYHTLTIEEAPSLPTYKSNLRCQSYFHESSPLDLIEDSFNPALFSTKTTFLIPFCESEKHDQSATKEDSSHIIEAARILVVTLWQHEESPKKKIPMTRRLATLSRTPMSFNSNKEPGKHFPNYAHVTLNVTSLVFTFNNTTRSTSTTETKETFTNETTIVSVVCNQFPFVLSILSVICYLRDWYMSQSKRIVEPPQLRRLTRNFGSDFIFDPVVQEVKESHGWQAEEKEEEEQQQEEEETNEQEQGKGDEVAQNQSLRPPFLLIQSPSPSNLAYQRAQEEMPRELNNWTREGVLTQFSEGQEAADKAEETMVDVDIFGKNETKEPAIDKTPLRHPDNDSSYCTTLPPDSNYCSDDDHFPNESHFLQEASKTTFSITGDCPIPDTVTAQDGKEDLTPEQVIEKKPRKRHRISLESRNASAIGDGDKSPELPSVSKKPRPFQNSSIVPDWVPSNRLQRMSQTFMEADEPWETTASRPRAPSGKKKCNRKSRVSLKQRVSKV